MFTIYTIQISIFRVFNFYIKKSQLDYRQSPDIGQKIFQWDMVHTIFTFLLLSFAQSGSNNAQAVVYTARMITINVINIAVCFNFTTTLVHAVRLKITPMASYGARLG